MPPFEEIVIEPNSGFKHYWQDIWRYRELFYILAWRDILVRYKQTVIGIAWALIRPLIMMIVFTIVFNKVAEAASAGFRRRIRCWYSPRCCRGSFFQPAQRVQQ